MTSTPPDPISEAQRFKRFVRPLLAVVALGFVLLAVRDVVSGWGETKVTLEPGLAAVACFPLFAAALLQGYAWIVLVERLGDRRVARGSAMSLYLFSQLARYTPGKVGLPLVRMAGASRLGLTPGLVGVSVLVENLSWIATGAVVGFGGLALTVSESGLGGLMGALAVPALCASVLGLLLLSVVDRSRYPKFARRLLAPNGTGPIVPLALPSLQIVYWLMIGAHGFLLSRALGAGFEASVSTMAFYAIASVAGLVVLAAPAGLGVREAILLAGLTPSIGASSALGAAVISRAGSLAADVLIWLFVRALSPTLRADDAR